MTQNTIGISPIFHQFLISITFQAGLLLTSFPTDGFDGPYFTLTLQNGQVYLSVNSSRKKNNELLVEEKVNDGKWKMIRFRYKHRRAKLTVENCDDDGFCEPCKSTRCVAAANNFEFVLSYFLLYYFVGSQLYAFFSYLRTLESTVIFLSHMKR